MERPDDAGSKDFGPNGRMEGALCGVARNSGDGPSTCEGDPICEIVARKISRATLAPNRNLSSTSRTDDRARQWG